MLPPLRHKALIALSITVSLTGCLAKEHVLRPPSPMILPSTPPPLSPVVESSISFPVQINLTRFLNAANDENVVPKTFDQSGIPIKHSKGAERRYYVERDDFAIARSDAYQSMSPDQRVMPRDWWKGIDLPGTRLPLTADLHSYPNTHAQPPAGRVPVDCGTGHERAKRTMVNGSIAIEMTPNYSLSGTVADVAVSAMDACNSRVATVDLPQEVKNRLTDSVREGLNQAVAHLNTSTIRTQVDEVWNGLRAPIQLEPNSWLQFNIDKIKHNGFSIGGQRLDDTIHVVANPVIVFGPEPPAITAGLPQLDTQLASPGYHVVADIPLDYASLSQSLAGRLQGKRIAVKGDFILITDASIFGLGGNQVLLKIVFTGDAIGHLYFVGKPEMNALTQTVQISGLRLDAATEQLLQKDGPDWLYRSSLQDLIGGEALLGMTPAIDRMRDLTTKVLNRALTPTITTYGTVASVQGIGVFADVNALYVRVMSDGSVNLKVDGKQ